MPKKILYGLLIIAVISTSLLFACTEPETTIKTSSASTTMTQAATSTSAVTSTSTANTANWWDKFGEPKYGGTITVSCGIGGSIPSGFDPANWMNIVTINLETLFTSDWIQSNRDIVTSGWISDEAYVGQLAESWDWTDSQTLVLHIREGVHWQNKEPVNGREFTAYDVQYHYDRVLGTGNGFTEPNPMFASTTTAIEKVVATDNYTCVYHFKNPTLPTNFWSIVDMNSQIIEARECIELGDKLTWQTSVGTGPWILSDYVANNSITAVKNPNYWGKDERHPENQLPYADTLKNVQIQDLSATLAAFRTGKIDAVWDVDWKQAQSLKESNPNLQYTKVLTTGNSLYYRIDTKPFSDIRVRQALAMAIDYNSIASGFYSGNADPTPYGLIPRQCQGYYYDYEDWPQTLKDKYSYNPTKAKELLSEAGYPDGFKTSMVMPNMLTVELPQIIKSYFSEVGVDMEITVLDTNVYGSMIMDKKWDQMHYFMGVPSPWMQLLNFTSKGQDWGRHNDSNLETLVEQLGEAPTLDDAKKLSVEADKYAIENIMVMRTPGEYSYQYWQSYIKGSSGEGRIAGPYRNSLLARLWIDQD